jgi:hypothetical protein
MIVSVIIGTIIATLMMSGIAAASPVKAGDIDCDIRPNHEYCTGEEGASGMAFCDLSANEDDRFGDCYDRDFSRIDCDEHPSHSRCVGFEGRDGLIFCDVAYEDLGYKPGCYDRNDNPRDYCDNYAIDESDRWYTAEFCQIICDNYDAVIGREEPCEN